MLGELMTPKELFETLGYSESHQRNLRSKGRLPYYKFGGKVFYKQCEIMALIEQNSYVGMT